MLQPIAIPCRSRSNPVLWSLVLVYFGQIILCGLAFAQKPSPDTKTTKNPEITPLALKDMEVIFVRRTPPYFVVNRGRVHGLALGDLICVLVSYDTPEEESAKDEKPSSQKPNEICGPIITLKSHAAGVNVHSQHIQRIQVEHAAIAVSIPKPPKALTLVTLGWIYGEKSPFIYKLTKFNLYAFTNANEPVWQEESERSSGFSSPTLEVGTLRSNLWPFGFLGLRLYRALAATDSVDVDYSVSNPQLHAKTTVTTSGTIMEPSLSYEDLASWDHFATGPVMGLQAGLNQMNHQVHLLDDQTGSMTRLVNYQARLWTASLNLGWMGRLTWKKIHADGSWKGSYPLWISAPSHNLQIDLPAGLPPSGADKEAYKNLVQLKKGAFSQQLSFGVGFQF